MGLCGCCSSSAKVQDEFNPIENTRKCRDLFCVLLFAVYWVGMLIVFVVGISTGQPERLVYAVDYNGDTCGVDGLQSKKYVYYPRIDLDVQEGYSAGVSPEDISFYGVCLNECPSPLPNNAGYDYVCNYETEEIVKEDMAATGLYDDKLARALFIQADFDSAQNVGLLVVGGKYTDGCWPVDIPTDELLFRCFWEFDEDVNVTEICTYPEDSADYYSVKPKYIDEYNDGDFEFPSSGGIASNKKLGEYFYPNENCKTKLSITVSEALAPANDNPLIDQLESWVSIVRRLYSDFEVTALYIILIGGIGTTVFAFLYLELMQMFAGLITWFVVSLVVILSAGLTVFCAYKGGFISSDDVSVLDDALSGEVTEVTGQLELEVSLEEENSKTYQILFYILAVVTIVLFVMVLFFRKKIKITIEIIREASSAIQTMPLLIFFPLVPWTLALINFIYFVVSTSYLLTAGDISESLLNVTESIESTIPSSTTTNTSNTTDVDLSGLVGLNIATIDADQALFYMMWYNLFGFLWTNQLIQAISMCTVAGAVSRWYWSRSKTVDEMGKFPITESFKFCFRYHLGSLLFGAFIVALVQLARAILLYIDQQTKKLQENNIVVKIILRVMHCCLWMLEKCMKFITKNCYIIIAMEGKAFFSACVRSFELFAKHFAQIGIVQTVSAFVLNLAKLSMCVGCGVLMFYYIESNDAYHQYGDTPLNYSIMPPLMTMILAYFVAGTFLNVFDLSIDTILLSYCLDKDKNTQPGTQFMSDSLKKLIGKNTDTSKLPAGE